MQVLHMCSEKKWRGGEQQVAYLIDELEKYGVKSVVALKKNSVLEQYCKKKNIRYFTLPFLNSIDFYSAWLLKKISKIEKVDLIHMHTSKSHGIGVLSAWLGNQVPLVLSRRVDFKPKTNFLTQWKYNHTNIKRIIGVSGKITEVMRKHVRDKEKCITIYSGIDLNKFFVKSPENILRKEYRIPDGIVLIGNTAALTAEKDYFTFIDTIEILYATRKCIHALVIGEGPLEKKLKDYVLRKGLQHLITFTGFRKNITEVMQCLDVFLMTSKEEGLGTSILDSFLAGIPVIATDAGGVPELVKHEKTGLLASVGESDMLAKNVNRLLLDKLLYQEMVSNASVYVKTFSKEITAKKTLEEYKKVLNN